jgi:putative FmdB family regulatory protein
MPIFDFKCRTCGHEFEELVRHDVSPACPSCGGAALDRLVSRPAVSTESTRQRSFSAARRRANAVQREKSHAQAEYERNYRKDHS